MNEKTDYINALLFPGSPKWPSNGITYNFLPDASSFQNYTPGALEAALDLVNLDYSKVDDNFVPFNDSQKAAAIKALNLWAEVADIQFFPKEDVALQLAEILDLGLVESGLKALGKWDDFADAIDEYVGDLIGFPVLDGADIRFGTTNAEKVEEPGTSGFAFRPPEDFFAQFNQTRQEIANFIDSFLAPLDWIGLTPSGLDVLKVFNFKGGPWGDVYLHNQDIDYGKDGLELLFEDYSLSNLDEGSDAFHTLLHEIGHALGLDHPHENTKMPEEKDNYHYTLMSYNDSSSDVVAKPSTPMLYDILAIQDLYGANKNTRKGNTTYSWEPDKPFMETIWDAGGKDTISAANQSVDVTINLNEGEFSSIGPKDISKNPDTAVENLAIAFDVTIENAVGGAGNDTLIGNDVKNQLKGGAGDDYLIGNGAADVFDGGKGFDVVSYNSAEKGITLNLTTGKHKGDAKGDKFESIEKIEGSLHADNITGSRKGDILDGSDGNDVVKGGAGNDTLMPGDGDDTIDGGKGNDVLVLDYSQLETRAIAWLGEEKDLLSKVFVGNAYGVGSPLKIPLIDEYTGGYAPSGGVVRISADGLKVAWEQVSNDSNEGFWMTEIGNPEAPVKIPNVPVDNLSFGDAGSTFFSSDLSKVAWLDLVRVGGNSGSVYNLYVANTDGTNLVKIASEITIPSGRKKPISLSGDGKKVAWTASDNNGVTQIFLANSDGRKIEQVSKVSFGRWDDDQHIDSPSLSDDGSIMTWREHSLGSYTPDYIWVRNSDGTIERKDEYQADEIQSLNVSEDGSKIFWLGFQPGHTPPNSNRIPGERGIWAFNTDGSGEEIGVVKEKAGGTISVDHLLRNSRDGETVAFQKYNDNDTTSLFVANADGTDTPTYIASSADLGNLTQLISPVLSNYVDMGVRYERFNPTTGSGQITTWGPSWVNFKSIEQFNLTGTRYDDELYGGNKNDTLIGGGGDDTLKAGKGDDIYQLDPKTAAGSQIEDTAGKDTLELIQTQVNQKKGEINLKEIKLSLSDVKRDDDNLLVNLNNNRKIDATEDLSIVNFFDGSKVGQGFIETVANLKGSDILNNLGGEGQGLTKNGNNKNNKLIGSKENDLFNGKGGNDILIGNKGDDILIGGGGKDTLNGGNGNDTYQLNAKNSKGSQIIDSGGNDILELKGANISLKGLAKGKTGVERKGKNLIIDLNQDGKANAKQDLTIKNFFANNKTNKPGKGLIETVDNVTGEEIIDSLTNPNQGVTKNGNKRNNTLKGGKLDDVLNGKGGNDKLLGNNGNDTLTGGNGNDKLNGGKGEDVLTGGKGKDSFIFTNINKTETDEITDFVLGEDKIILDKSAFKVLKSRKGNGFSRKREFAIVDDAAEVASSKAFIVYNENSGELLYNSNGNKAGLGNGGLFAKLEGAPDIGVTDFKIQL